MAKNPFASLPPELLITIFEYLVPNPVPIALPPSHPTTKVLLALTRTSRDIYPVASRLLYTYCVYIDGSERLHRLAFTLTSQTGRSTTHDEGLFLERINSVEPVHHFLPPISVTYSSLLKAYHMKPRLPTLPTFTFCENITGMYLNPQCSWDHINDIAVAHSMHNIVHLVRANLQRLVVDFFTKRKRERENAQAIRLALRSTFWSLPKLEAFFSIQSDFYLDYSCSREEGEGCQTPVWSGWPKLKVLALRQSHLLDPKFWEHLTGVSTLETIVIVDGLGNYSFSLPLLRSSWQRLQSVRSRPERDFEIFLLNYKIKLNNDDHSWRTPNLVVREIQPQVRKRSNSCRDTARELFLSGEPLKAWKDAEI